MSENEARRPRKLSELCGTLDDGPVKGVCGRMEWKKGGYLYDVYEFTCCGYEYSESRTCDYQTELVPNFCPNCGARIEE